MAEEQQNNFNIIKIWKVVGEIWKKGVSPFKWIVLALAIIGAFFMYYSKKDIPVTYTGESSFMLASEDIASQASSFNAEANPIISGFLGSQKSNKAILLELFKSNKMKELTLLSLGKVNGETDLLINHFLKFRGVKPGDSLLYDTSFAYGVDEYRDSYLRQIAKRFYEPSFKVTLDKSGLFYLKFTHIDQDFALCFINNHIDVIRQYYTEKRIEKANQVLDFAREHRDETKRVLSSAEFQLAALLDRSSGVVMHRALTEKIKLERKIEIYNEMYLSAEISYQTAKVNVLSRTPYIQFIDEAKKPLIMSNPNPYIITIAIFVLILFFGIAICVGMYFLKAFLAKQRSEYLNDPEVHDFGK